MSLVLAWRAPSRTISTRWRGPAGMLSAIARDPELALAAIIGPPGPSGSNAQPLRIDASLAATWILTNPLGRIPAVHVYLASGEPVLTDVAATTSQITITFPSPQQGFVLAL